MKTYVVLDRILLNNQFAEDNDIPNRWLNVGELIDLPDPSARRLVEKGDIELYVSPKPKPAAKKAAPKKDENKEAK